MNATDCMCCIQGGRTPLHYACMGGHLDVAQLLVERGASVTDKNKVRVMSSDVYAMTHMYLWIFVCMYL